MFIFYTAYFCFRYQNQHTPIHDIREKTYTHMLCHKFSKNIPRIEDRPNTRTIHAALSRGVRLILMVAG